MASPSLALPGVVFVGEDERSRLVVHLGAASGWMIPKGILGWSTEVAVVAREALTEEVRRDAKIVMPEEQVPPARMPLTHQATQKAPLVAVSGRLVPKLVEKGVRVHTIGADRVTSSFYYIGEGGGEPEVRVEGDLVAAVGAMLGDRADNAAIERVLDGLVDRLLRSLSKDRVNELSVELAAALPRAAADGSGMQDIDLDGFEKDLGALIGSSEKYSGPLREIGEKLTGATDRKLDIPLFVDAKKVSQGPFELAIGERTVALGTAEHWVASGPFSEPKAAAKPAPTPAPAAATPAPSPKPAPAKVEAKPEPKPASKAETPKPAKAEPKAATPAAAPAANAEPPPAGMKPLAAPMSPPVVAPPRPASNPPPAAQPAAAAAAAPAASRSDEIKPAPVVAVVANPPPSERKPAPAPEPVKVAEPVKVEAAPEPKPAPEPVKVAEPVKVEAAPEPKPAPEPAKIEPKAEAPKAAPEPAKAEPKREPKAAASDARPKRDERPSQAIAEKKNFPWIWVLIAAGVAMAAAWRFLFAGK